MRIRSREKKRKKQLVLYRRIYYGKKEKIIYDDAQPIKGFSQRSLVSHSIFHFFVLFVPDCIAFRADTNIRQRRSLNIFRGTPEIGPMDS